MIKTLIRFALRQRLLVVGIALLLMMLGLHSARELPIDVLPDLNKPTVTIMTEAAGMAPGEVEQQLSFPIERAMSGLSQVSHIRSISAPGLSTVEIRFDWQADIYRSRQLVNERLALLRPSLPDNFSPQLGAISSIMGEVMLLALHSPDERLDAMALRDLADWDLRPRLLALPGVSQVTVIGGNVRQYQVHPKVSRLQYLGIPLDRLQSALTDFGRNHSGGYLRDYGADRPLRHIGQTTRLADFRNLPVDIRDSGILRLEQLATVDFGAKVKRGDASLNARPAVILSVQKQPATDTLALTSLIETQIQSMRHGGAFPADIDVVFRQADFIERATDNLTEALIHASLIVLVVLFLFLMDSRATLISLLAIPLSVLTTAIIFRHFGFTINTMTLGGIAIAVGELVDDAIVGVENVSRRLRQKRPPDPTMIMRTILDATLEVRTAIYNATLIIIIVFIPLFALDGIEGRLFGSLGIAYITSIAASLLVSLTLTPVLCYYFLGRRRVYRTDDTPVLSGLKSWARRLLDRTLSHPTPVTATMGLSLLAASLALLQLPATFLPPFNEGSLTVNLIARPGTSLQTSNHIGTLAEKALLELPEVSRVGRRTGRAELDEHAEGVNYSELDVILEPGVTDFAALRRRIHERLSMLPVRLNIGQPISHRLDHLLAAVRADMAAKIYGPDLSTTQAVANDLREKLASNPALTDLQLEQETLVAEIHITPDADAGVRLGIRPAELNTALSTLTGGAVLAQVLDGGRRHDLVFRLSEAQRRRDDLGRLLIASERGPVPLQQVARIDSVLQPNRITHENGRRRSLVYANLVGDDHHSVLRQIRRQAAELDLPPGYSVELEGRVKSQESSRQRILGLSIISVLLILAVLYNRYRSFTLSAIIMINLPFALSGGLIALWLSGNPLSMASLVGFVTLIGISTRNGILKVSHYINLFISEDVPFGRELVIRGSLERLAPVFMTALVSILALIPLLFDGAAPGKEILHPVAVVICGGLIGSTLLDMLFTPILFYRWGKRPLEHLRGRRENGLF